MDRATSLHEVWALVAAFSGLIGAWRLTGVCKAARTGAKEWLGTLPGLVLCGRYAAGERKRVVEAESSDAAVGAHACGC